MTLRTRYGNASNAMRSMASQSRKHRGYRTQRVVAQYLAQWWEHAESAGAGRQGKDITGVPFDLEVKARSAFQPKAWLDQVRQRLVIGELPIVVMRFNGQGEDASTYGAMLRFDDLVSLLLKAGYSEQSLQIDRCKQCGGWMTAICGTCRIEDERNAHL